jgi:hypothetical protein
MGVTSNPVEALDLFVSPYGAEAGNLKPGGEVAEKVGQRAVAGDRP